MYYCTSAWARLTSALDSGAVATPPGPSGELSTLTPEVLGQAQQQAHRLVVLVPRAARGAQHQGLGARGPRGPQDPVHVGALHHLGGVGGISD